MLVLPFDYLNDQLTKNFLYLCKNKFSKLKFKNRIKKQ